jgi:6-phosphogluconolactonase
MMPMEPRILISPDSDGWVGFAANAIGQEISSVITRKKTCHVMLTGGRTAERLYRYWADMATLPLDGLRFLFGDERCVPPGHADSNYALVMKTLFDKGLPPGCSIARMEGENPELEVAAKEYEELLPEAVDVLLLSVGEDGHIASLFPHHSALREDKRKVVPVIGPKPPYERLTITPRVIDCAKSIFLLATGKEKGAVLAEALKSSSDIMSLPVTLISGGIWLLDDAAASRILSREKVKRALKDD